MRDGLQGGSISAICAEAQISPGHLYHYFDSKESIVEAITEAYLADVQEHFGTLSESKSVISVIVSAIERAIEHSKVGKQALVFEMMGEASRNPKIATIVQESTKVMRSLLADLIRTAQERGEVDTNVDPEIAAPIIIGMIDAAKVMCTRNADLDVAKSVSSMSTMIAALLADSAVEKSSQKRKSD